MVLYGQIVIGAPGAGKTTYCDGMQQYLRLLGRECYVVNLDPANEVPPVGDDDDGDGGNENRGDDVGVDGGDCPSQEIHDENDDDDNANDGHGNSQLPYETILDVCQDVVSLESVMAELDLGPNGGLLYCMEYVERHLGEVLTLLRERLGIRHRNDRHASRAYLLFDLPGQIELTAHSNVVPRIAQRLARELDLRLVCVQLVDAAVCMTDVSKFIGAALICTASMMRLELPCVNVLSKMDLLQGNPNMRNATTANGDDSDDECDYDYGAAPLAFNLEFFTQCHNLHRLVDYLDSNPMDLGNEDDDGAVDLDGDPAFDYREDPEYQRAQRRTKDSAFHRKYRKLHNELCDVVEDYGLLSFLPLSIQDAESVGRVVARVDKCNGYVFLRENGGDTRSSSRSEGRNGGGDDGNANNLQDMFSSAMVADSEWAAGVLSDVQEKYLGDVMFREDVPELDKKKECKPEDQGDTIK